MALNPQKLIIGAFIGVAEQGDLVDGVTVSKTAFPDNDPATNYTDIGCVQDVQFSFDEEEEEDYCPNVSGNGYTKEVTKIITADYMDLTVRDHTEMVFRMLFGKSGKIVNGTPFKPWDVSDRSIYVVLRIGAKGGGNDLIDGTASFIYGKLTLQDYPGWSRETTRPVVRFQKLDSTLNSFTPQNIA